MKKFVAAIVMLTAASAANAFETVKPPGVAFMCHSKVAQLGRDTYWGKPKVGNGCGTEYTIQAAATYCGQRGKEFLVTRMEGLGKNQIHFQCLARNDSDYVRPKYEKDPDVVVQVRR